MTVRLQVLWYPSLDQYFGQAFFGGTCQMFHMGFYIDLVG